MLLQLLPRSSNDILFYVSVQAVSPCAYLFYVSVPHTLVTTTDRHLATLAASTNGHVATESAASLCLAPEESNYTKLWL